MRTGSILSQIVALTLLVLTVAMGLSLALVLLTPPPEPGRINILEMAYALEGHRSKVISVVAADAPPEGTRSPLVEAALARKLGADPSNVRVIWKDIPGAAFRAQESIILIDGRDVLVSTTPDGFALRYGEGVELAPETFVPLFEGALRLPDGRWRLGRPDDQARDAWRLRIILAFAVAGLVLMAPAWLIARRIAAPITALGRAAGQTRLTTDAPFPAAGPPEVRAAAQAMNAMHGRLAEQAEERVRMLAAVAHDLRTPLTALRLRADTLHEPLKGRMGADLRRMGELIDHSLEFAMAGSRRPRLTQVRLDDVARGVVARVADLGAEVVLTEAAPAAAFTDPLLLERALANLIDNAVRYGVRARVSVLADRDEAVLRVDDDGPGIPEALLDRAVRPFERLEPSRNRDKGGTGLGLAIVSDLTDALGGQLTLTNTGEGLRAEIRLPVSPVEQPLPSE